MASTDNGEYIIDNGKYYANDLFFLGLARGHLDNALSNNGESFKSNDAKILAEKALEFLDAAISRANKEEIESERSEK